MLDGDASESYLLLIIHGDERLAIEGQPIQIGDTIRGELWNEPVRLDDIEIMGDFLKVGVTPTGSSKSEERFLHISKNIDVLMKSDTEHPPS